MTVNQPGENDRLPRVEFDVAIVLVGVHHQEDDTGDPAEHVTEQRSDVLLHPASRWPRLVSTTIWLLRRTLLVGRRNLAALISGRWSLVPGLSLVWWRRTSLVALRRAVGRRWWRRRWGSGNGPRCRRSCRGKGLRWTALRRCHP